MDINIYSSNGSSSRAFDAGSYDPTVPNIGCAFNGYAVFTTPVYNALGVYLVPVPTDPWNTVDVYLGAYASYGNALVTVSQSAGTCDNTTMFSSSLPHTGWCNLATYATFMSQIATPLGTVDATTPPPTTRYE